MLSLMRSRAPSLDVSLEEGDDRFLGVSKQGAMRFVGVVAYIQ